MKKLLVRMSGNPVMQRLLGRNVVLSQYLMGIGSGDFVDSSGEVVVIDRLRQIHAATERSLCIFDVGSNEGQFLTLIMGGLQSASFNVHAFEPSRRAFDRLSDRARSYSNVRLNNFGLGKERGEFRLFYDKAGSGLASLSQRRLGHLGIEFESWETVRIETLDDYCDEQHIQHIDLLKLDVEGHELDVLLGSQKMFREQRIEMITFEFGGTHIDSRTYFQDFWYFFAKNGMEHIFRITPSGFLVPIRQYREEYEQFRTTNFLVLQK